MATLPRPTIKRTYGRPKPPPSSSPAPASSSWADLTNDNNPVASTSASTLTNRPSLAHLTQVSTSSSFLRSSSPCPAPETDDDLPASTPPTSQKENTSPTRNRTTRPASPEKRPVTRISPAKVPAVKPTSAPAKRPAPPAGAKPKTMTLHAFFKPAEQPNKRQKLDTSSTSPEPTARKPHQPLLPGRRAAASTSTATPSTPTKPKPKSTPAPKLEQLFLDPFEDAGHSMVSCKECSMSYARTPEDMAVHAKHHKKVVGGCDWLSGDGVGKGCTLVEDGIEWGAKGKDGKIIMVEAGTEGLTGKKLNDLLAVIDTSLSATSLTTEQLAESKAFVFVTPQRKAIACALVQRITHAYQVVPAPSHAQTASASNVLSSPTAPRNTSAPLLKFDGDDDMGAIFCSPTPVPTLLGVHRIWTVPARRRAGLASLLLDAAATRFIYGYPVTKARRGAEVAFSQPTGKGQALARRWTGGGELRVFVD